MNTKTEVMQPIREFFAEVNARVQRTILGIEAQIQHTISIALGLAFLSTIMMIFSIVQTLRSLSKANEENDLLLLNILPESIPSLLALN